MFFVRIMERMLNFVLAIFPFLRNPKLYLEVLPFIAIVYVVTFIVMDENPFILVWGLVRMFVVAFFFPSYD